MDGLKIEQLQSLQSKDQAALLDTVDEIRRHGVNRYVSLPQLIVCGDQSSGKSSVLEAISGVQFPVNDGLCTRFTTEVILRRATKSLATVKLIPSKDASPSHKEKLSQFEKSSINHAEIPDLISEAKSFMGLTGSSTFSRDVLQLEVSGPKLPHLTLVDLPGLIHHPNKEQTEEDVRIPKELVQKYMSQSRSIVLAIVTAKNDTSNQVVLEMAKAADPQGSRTMGIITKPDCLIKDSPNESNFFALASNKETYFKLDWHVLRNGDFNERKGSTFDRDAVEKDFFASTIWKNLPSHKRGVEALRTRLSHVLYQQIQKELPSLLWEIEAELAACKTTLDRLGLPRDTPSSRRQYLTGIAGRFLDLVRGGTEGIYQDSFFRPVSSGFTKLGQMKKTRLRAKVRMEEQTFLDRMHRYGHTHIIVSKGSEGDDVDPQARLFESGLRDGQTIIPEEEYLSKIRTLLNISKGRELPGTFTPLIAGDLFIRQSKNWKPFAIDFVEGVWNIVKEFLDDVLIHVADENVRQALLEEILDPAMDKILVKLKDKVTELHSPYARASPATLSPRFIKELENRRSKQAENPPVQPISLFVKTDTDDADWHACRELLLLMQSYYTIALDVFVDNVSNLAVENCLMNALENLLSPLIVSEMSDEELENIAFESPDIREVRSQTLEKQSSLQKSYELCRRQARKLTSSRLNEEMQKVPPKTETLQTSVREGIAKVNISPAASTTTPTKVTA
jgi:GTPase SAR1 family protein